MSDLDLHRGVELHELQIWRDAETDNIIIEVPPGLEQVVFTPAQWRRACNFLFGKKPEELAADGET